MTKLTTILFIQKIISIDLDPKRNLSLLFLLILTQLQPTIWILGTPYQSYLPYPSPTRGRWWKGSLKRTDDRDPDLMLGFIHLSAFYVILVPAQDVHFFYTRSNLSALQSCALIFSTNFSLFSHLNSERQNLFIELCRALKIKFFYGYLVNLRTVL